MYVRGKYGVSNIYDSGYVNNGYKASVALNIALNVAKKYPKKTVAFFSLEMSKQQLVTRLLANESFVDNKKLTTGQLTVDEWGKIGIASSALSQTDLRVDDNPSVTVAEMNAICRRIDDLIKGQNSSLQTFLPVPPRLRLE